MRPTDGKWLQVGTAGSGEEVRLEPFDAVSFPLTLFSRSIRQRLKNNHKSSETAMPINILMPALSPTMEKGNLAKW